jgi:hypothetical protein
MKYFVESRQTGDGPVTHHLMFGIEGTERVCEVAQGHPGALRAMAQVPNESGVPDNSDHVTEKFGGREVHFR